MGSSRTTSTLSLSGYAQAGVEAGVIPSATSHQSLSSTHPRAHLHLRTASVNTGQQDSVAKNIIVFQRQLKAVHGETMRQHSPHIYQEIFQWGQNIWTHTPRISCHHGIQKLAPKPELVRVMDAHEDECVSARPFPLLHHRQSAGEESLGSVRTM